MDALAIVFIVIVVLIVCVGGVAIWLAVNPPDNDGEDAGSAFPAQDPCLVGELNLCQGTYYIKSSTDDERVGIGCPSLVDSWGVCTKDDPSDDWLKWTFTRDGDGLVIRNMGLGPDEIMFKSSENSTYPVMSASDLFRYNKYKASNRVLVKSLDGLNRASIQWLPGPDCTAEECTDGVGMYFIQGFGVTDTPTDTHYGSLSSIPDKGIWVLEPA